MIVNEDVGAHGAAERVHRRDGIMRHDPARETRDLTADNTVRFVD
jgi:hypothetical protein